MRSVANRSAPPLTLPPEAGAAAVMDCRYLLLAPDRRDGRMLPRRVDMGIRKGALMASLTCNRDKMVKVKVKQKVKVKVKQKVKVKVKQKVKVKVKQKVKG